MVVDDARCRAADAQQRTVQAADDLAGEADDRRGGLLAGFAVACLRMPGHDLAGKVHDGGFDHVVVAEIEGDDMACIRLDTEQRGWLARARDGLATDLGDQPVGDQLCGDRRNRRSGEAAVAGEVGATLRAIGVEGLQQQRAIAGTGIRRCRLRRRRRAAIGLIGGPRRAIGINYYSIVINSVKRFSQGQSRIFGYAEEFVTCWD